MRNKQDRKIMPLSTTLPFGLYQEFYHAIVTDDDVFVNNQIQKDWEVVNGRFDYSSPEDQELSKSIRKRGDLQPHYPLTLAVSKGSIKVMRILLEQKADIRIKESDGYNIIHILLVAASKGIPDDPKLLETYDIIENDKAISDLLLEESDDGLRPLEMAACLGLMTFTKRIMNTPGVYLAKTLIKGDVVYKWFDVTDYEKLGWKSRRDRSPLFFLRQIDIQDVEKKETVEIFK